jgi:general secretion pathway protein F
MSACGPASWRTLTGAGFPLVTALTTLVSQTKTQGFTKIAARIKDSIVEGNSFASSLTLYPSVFLPDLHQHGASR